MMSEGAVGEAGGLVLRRELLVQSDGSANSDYRVLSFQSDLGPGESNSVPIILITEIESKLLVAVPLAFWHRLVRQRLIPSPALSKAVSVAVAAVEDDHRDLIVENIFIKVWIGFLAPSFEECIEVPADEDHLVWPTEDDEEGFVPFGRALMAVADEKFEFLSAESGIAEAGAPDTQHRLTALEDGLAQIQQSLLILMDQRSAQKDVMDVAKPKAVPPRAVPLPPKGDGIAGLDKGAVQAALQAGVERSHLEELAGMLGGGAKGRLGDAPGLDVKARKSLKLNVLGESEEEAEDPHHPPDVQAGAVNQDPMVTAITQLASIVGSLAGSKKKSKLEDTLEEAVLFQDSGASSSSSSSRRHSAVIQSLRKALRDHPEELYAVMERKMLDDFGAPEEAPGSPTRSGSFRGWAEHRSKIPNIPATVRTVWGITGALDALRGGRVAEGKARLILLLGQIDQLAVDRGQAVLSAEGSLEDAPPFSSFAKHVPPDIYESQHTKLWPATWAEAFMWKVKELDEFVERRQKLGKRGHNPNLSDSAAAAAAAAKSDPKKKPSKGAGKGNKAQDSAASQEAGN